MMQKYGVEFGQTILFCRERDRRRWEPNASTVRERFEAASTAHAAGVRTWVSVEPVIDPEQALYVIGGMSAVVDVWKVGKLNHDAEREKAIDWRDFLRRALEKLELQGAEYYIKDHLWAFADEGIRARWPKERTKD